MKLDPDQIQTGNASYAPEDNKLRLYVGRVPRPEFDALRAEGWTCTPKQSCDFVATWTPERRDTALAYGNGVIEDEDQPMAERAADRAERFGGYRDKRTEEATGHADRYDSGPSAHGYQSQARAERAAARHDRIADRSCDAWSKAEYWQRRTAGVISHALYKSTPGVRMGRIKVIEKELRAKVATYEKAARLHDLLKDIQAMPDVERQTKEANRYFGSVYSTRQYPHPDAPEIVGTLESLLRCEKARPITGAEACALYFSDHSRPTVENNDWANHYKLRLAYENQMLEAQGGRLEQCEIQPGGKLGGMLILKVNKSTATGRPTSVSVLRKERLEGWHYKSSNIPGTEWSEHQIDTERLAPGSYAEPTPESLTELASVKAAIKGASPKKDPCPLINPTDEDAQRLQDLWNAQALADREASYKRNFYSLPVTDCKPVAVCRITQAVYSANSGGTYSKAETRGVFKGGIMAENYYNAAEKQRAKHGLPVCKVRVTSGGCYEAQHVIIITDKPQKPLPAAVWAKAQPEQVAA